MTFPYSYEFEDGRTVEVQQDAAGLGTTVWDACLVTAKYAEMNLARLAVEGFSGKGTRPPSKKRSTADSSSPLVVVELGCGTGLLGFVGVHTLASLKQSVTLVATDTPRVVDFASTNLASIAASLPEHVSVRAEPFEWALDGTVPDHIRSIGPVDIVLMSDCVYDPTGFDPLCATLANLCHDNTLIVMGYERRNFDAEVSFFKRFGETFRFRHIKEEEMDPRFRAPDEIYVFLAKKRVDADDF
ncbi:Methyltransferase-like protein 21D [Chytriomyces hyalinus]|nr:Methyltransferase-like protein 21D [Chytriomyces hyalinus]